jgi:putative peptide zinc metalloprotease protein
LVAGAAALAGFTAWMWWPNGEYRPIQPGERGTIQAAVRDLAYVPTGRPSLTVERQRQLRGAPTRRSLQHPARRRLAAPVTPRTRSTETPSSATPTTPTTPAETTSTPDTTPTAPPAESAPPTTSSPAAPPVDTTTQPAPTP